VPEFRGTKWHNDSIDILIKLILQEYKWQPTVIGGLFLDKVDYEGLVWLAEDIIKRCKKEQ
jgi:hypothetical protein